VETGERKRATILKIYSDHVEKAREHPDLIKVRLKVGDNEFDDLIAYNEVLDFIQDDYEVTDGIDKLWCKTNSRPISPLFLRPA
jgi:hypothetical protein